MAHNLHLRPGGLWPMFSLLTSAIMATVDEYLFESINGDQGGTWAPAAPIIIGGAGLWVTGYARLDDADVTIANGRTFLVESGGTIHTIAGSTSLYEGDATIDATWTVTSGAVLEIDNGGDIDVLNGGNISFESGSTFEIKNGATGYIRGGGTLEVQAVLGNAGAIVFNALSRADFMGVSSAIWRANANAVFQGSSTLTHNNLSVEDYDYGSEVNVGTTFQFTGIALEPAGAEFNIHSSIQMNSGSDIVMGLGSVQTFQTNSILNIYTEGVNVGSGSFDGGIDMSPSGGHTAFLNFVGSGAVAQFFTGSAFTMFFGSVATLLGATTISNLVSLIRTGKETLSGADAYQITRFTTHDLNDTGNVLSIAHPEAFEYIQLVNSGTVTLQVPGGLEDAVVTRVFMPILAAGAITLKSGPSGSQIAVLNPTAAQIGFGTTDPCVAVTVITRFGNWRVCGFSGDVSS
jgi:hypothetical protein